VYHDASLYVLKFTKDFVVMREAKRDGAFRNALGHSSGHEYRQV